MLDHDTIVSLGTALDAALSGRQPMPRISITHPEAGLADAYAISRAVLDCRLARGEKVSGKKIGLTTKVVQQALGIDEPDYGFLTDAMEVPEGGTVNLAASLITPFLEPEIAFILKDRLRGPGVTADMVLAATDHVRACIEIVDSRFDNPQIGIVDTVADNASSALYVLGDERLDPREVDLAALACTISRNGEMVHGGQGAAVMGNPLNSVAWLANRMSDFGVSLDPGDVILSGSMTPFVKAGQGERFVAEFGVLGTVSVSFA